MPQKVFGFAGWSGSGKTTLIEQVISHLASTGMRISLVKHAHHDFDFDIPGKDSYRHRKAGASEVLVTSAKRYALIREHRDAPELSFEQSIARLSPCDLVLIEGFKRTPIPKLEIWRAEIGKPLLFPTDTNIRGICTDDPLPLQLKEPFGCRFGLGEIASIAAFAAANAVAVGA
ncbi:MAG: molybdopterin-guanine dinucleotide biosynthesis protein B [Burkholderiales bacterium]|nr:MAG: molybdopterin-guanine dinucleotide biosynthesis protein B [Burkholderiales bacterium]TAG78493.1 MAG: molybdopterin-guanine dinucleotide biosynthesis protein B [Betaproteobacteria bacterium]